MLLASWSTPATALDSRRIFELNEQRIFQIRVLNRETGKKSSIGSGFVIGSGKLVATNYHVISEVVSEPEQYYVTYLGSDGDSGELKLTALDVAHDLALLSAETRLADPVETATLPAKGAAIYAMGNPHDLGLTIAVGTNGGILDQTDASRILFSGSLNPGMSGGPTFDANGRVIGINVSTARNDISFIVPSRYLQGLIELQQTNAVENFQDEVTRQVLAYETSYLQTISGLQWPTMQIRQFRVPGAISPTIRCWDASSQLAEDQLYERFHIRCSNQNEIYLDQKNPLIGQFKYGYYWLESDQLNPLQFYSLYEELNDDQLRRKTDQGSVSNYNCDNWFVQVAEQDFKANLCRREYNRYDGLSDILFTAAMTGYPDRGFFITLTFTGVSYQASLPVIQKFLEQVEWTN